MKTKLLKEKLTKKEEALVTRADKAILEYLEDIKKFGTESTVTTFDKAKCVGLVIALHTMEIINFDMFEKVTDCLYK